LVVEIDVPPFRPYTVAATTALKKSMSRNQFFRERNTGREKR